MTRRANLPRLTPRQREVLALLADNLDGLTGRQLAARMGGGRNAVSGQLTRLSNLGLIRVDTSRQVGPWFPHVITPAGLDWLGLFATSASVRAAERSREDA